MEHKLVIGGEQFLPFARSCVVKLKKLGLPYADQSYSIEGVTIRVRIEPGHEYIHIEGGGTPHGFLVTSGWSDPAFYKHIVTDKVRKWDGFLPAGKWAEKRMTYNALNNADMTMPMVLNTDGTKLRTYGQRLLTHTKDITTIPLNLEGVTRFGFDNTILAENGKVLYTVADSGNILIDGTDEIHHLPFDSVAEGSFVVYNSWRYGVISMIYDLIKYRFCSEVITPGLALVSRTTQEFVAPIPGVSAGTYDTPGGMGESAKDGCFINTVGSTAAFLVPRRTYIYYSYGNVEVASLPYFNVLWGVADAPFDVSAGISETFAGYRNLLVSEKTSEKIDNVLVLAGINNTTTVSITNELNYTVNQTFRAGWSDATIASGSMPGGFTSFYGVHQYEIQRYESVYSLDGTPKLTINLGWADIRILEGTAMGNLTGHKYQNHVTGNRTNLYYFTDATYDYVTRAIDPPLNPADLINGIPWVFGLVANNGDIVNQGAVHEAALGSNIKQKYIDLDAYWRRDWYEYDNETPANTASFDYTSRYVIDYDHKSQFYACIRVRVTCSETGMVYQGTYWGDFINPTDNPTYTVEIAFEWNWQGELGEKVLLTASGQMFPYSFEWKDLGNPYRWPFDEEFHKLIFMLPPTLTPPPLSYEQLATLGVHQGANTHYAGSEAGSIPDNTKVPAGVLYSTPNKHKGIVPGMLYCRTISLTDVGEALWMLSSLCIDAPVNNAYPIDQIDDIVMWHYFPQLGADIQSKKFRIELRDGALVQWTDDVPVNEGATRPAAENRTDVSLYVV